MDLSGIKTAIEEDLGVTVIAESTIPDSLKTIPSPMKTGELGDIGITLLSAENEMTEATAVLADHIEKSLQ